MISYSVNKDFYFSVSNVCRGQADNFWCCSQQRRLDEFRARALIISRAFEPQKTITNQSRWFFSFVTYSFWCYINFFIINYLNNAENWYAYFYSVNLLAVSWAWIKTTKKIPSRTPNWPRLEVSPSKERCAMCEFLGQLYYVVNLMIF